MNAPRRLLRPTSVFTDYHHHRHPISAFWATRLSTHSRTHSVRPAVETNVDFFANNNIGLELLREWYVEDKIFNRPVRHHFPAAPGEPSEWLLNARACAMRRREPNLIRKQAERILDSEDGQGECNAISLMAYCVGRTAAGLCSAYEQHELFSIVKSFVLGILERNMVPSSIMCYLYITLCEQNNRPEDAFVLWEKLNTKGCPIDHAVFSALARCFALGARKQELLIVYQDFIETIANDLQMAKNDQYVEKIIFSPGCAKNCLAAASVLACAVLTHSAPATASFGSILAIETVLIKHLASQIAPTPFATTLSAQQKPACPVETPAERSALSLGIADYAATLCKIIETTPMQSFETSKVGTSIGLRVRWQSGQMNKAKCASNGLINLRPDLTLAQKLKFAKNDQNAQVEKNIWKAIESFRDKKTFASEEIEMQFLRDLGTMACASAFLDDTRLLKTLLACIRKFKEKCSVILSEILVSLYDVRRIEYVEFVFNEFGANPCDLTAKATMTLGCSYSKLGKAKKAMELFERAVRENPHWTDDHKMLVINSMLDCVLRNGFYAIGEEMVSRIMPLLGVEATANSYGKLLNCAKYINQQTYITPPEVAFDAKELQQVAQYPLSLQRALYWSGMHSRASADKGQQVPILMDSANAIGQFDLSLNVFKNGVFNRSRDRVRMRIFSEDTDTTYCMVLAAEAMAGTHAVLLDEMISLVDNVLEKVSDARLKVHEKHLLWLSYFLLSKLESVAAVATAADLDRIATLLHKFDAYSTPSRQTKLGSNGKSQERFGAVKDSVKIQLKRTQDALRVHGKSLPRHTASLI